MAIIAAKLRGVWKILRRIPLSKRPGSDMTDSLVSWSRSGQTPVSVWNHRSLAARPRFAEARRAFPIFLKVSAPLLALCISGTAPATYTANFAGVIKDVITYDDSHFLIRLDPMPSGPCSQYFIVTTEVPADARQMLLSRALTAHATGAIINIGYDDSVCVNGWYRVHRVG